MYTMNITDQEFKLISQLVYQKFGINLTEQKRTLILERLQKTLYLGGFTNFKDYYDYVISEPSGKALLHLVDRLSTNYTYFFREKEHYSFLTSTLLPRLVELQNKRGTRSIKIWSAGCSSGEEPYTLAMVISEFFGKDLPKWDIGILATDISVTALDKAQAGIYTGTQLNHVPPAYRISYFSPDGNGNWTVNPELKKLILFRRLNLTNQEYPFKGRFNLISCRNVMIYFDDVTRQGIIERFHRFTEPEGHLFIGHSESLNQVSTMYRFVQPAIYQKNY